MPIKWDILGLGAVAVDDLLLVDQYPGPDTKTQVLQVQRHTGGLAATALVAAARQGCRTAYCGVLGEDERSAFILQTFRREGVDCSQIRIRPEARPICAFVIVEQPTGRRSILFSHEGFMPPGPDQVTGELIGSCKVLFVDHTVLPAGTRAARLARQLGIPVVADIEPVNDLSSLSEFIAAVDHLIIGIELARQLTGQSDPQAIVSALSCPERVCTVVTAGDQGCWYSERCGPVKSFPAFSLPVVDTTGCGDVFHGAYAAALSRSEPIDYAIQAATAAAGIKTTKAGGQPGIPDLETVQLFLQEHLPSTKGQFHEPYGQY